jgi:hypothetical protein
VLALAQRSSEPGASLQEAANDGGTPPLKGESRSTTSLITRPQPSRVICSEAAEAEKGKSCSQTGDNVLWDLQTFILLLW